MTEEVWRERDTTPSKIEAALRHLLIERYHDEDAFVPARVLNLVVVVDGSVARGAGHGGPGADRLDTRPGIPGAVTERARPGAVGRLHRRPHVRRPLRDDAVGADRRRATAGAGAVGGAGGVDLELTVTAEVPPGSSLGTSAAVLVAVVAALDALGGAASGPDDVARAAHAVETDRAGRESGVQDHVAAAHGGASWIAIDAYPGWERTEVALPAGAEQELADRLVTVHLGGGHDHHEEGGHLPVEVAVHAGERDEREVAGVEHELHAHEHDDRVAPGEHADRADREQDRGEHDEVRGVHRPEPPWSEESSRGGTSWSPPPTKLSTCFSRVFS